MICAGCTIRPLTGIRNSLLQVCQLVIVVRSSHRHCACLCVARCVSLVRRVLLSLCRLCSISLCVLKLIVRVSLYRISRLPDVGISYIQLDSPEQHISCSAVWRPAPEWMQHDCKPLSICHLIFARFLSFGLFFNYFRLHLPCHHATYFTRLRCFCVCLSLF